jgi:hypothetical protein
MVELDKPTEGSRVMKNNEAAKPHTEQHVRISRADVSILVGLGPVGICTAVEKEMWIGSEPATADLFQAVNTVVGQLSDLMPNTSQRADAFLLCCARAGMTAQLTGESTHHLVGALDLNTGLVLTQLPPDYQTTGGDDLKSRIAGALRQAMQKLALGDVHAFCAAVEAEHVDDAIASFPRKLEANDIAKFTTAIEQALGKTAFQERRMAIAILSADVLWKSDQLDDAGRLASQALAMAQGAKDKSAIFGIWLLQGNIQAKRGRFALALEHYAAAEALEHAVEPAARAWLYHNRASTFVEQNKYEDAIRNYELAAELRRSVREGARLSPCRRHWAPAERDERRDTRAYRTLVRA